MNDTPTNITTETLDKALFLAGLMTVSQVCRAIPGSRGNQSVRPSTVTRWILIGCPARNGDRIKLKATRCGSRWLIDPIHLAEFFDALGCITPNATAPAPRQQRTASRRQSAAVRAAQELKRRGA